LSQTKLHFARFEFKYILPKQLRDELERELQFFMEFDPYVQKREAHQYFVRSLYFDDPEYSCFYDKIEGMHTRSKFRIRTYTKEQDGVTPQFLEIKGRHNNLVIKHRTPIDGEFMISDEKDGVLVDRALSGLTPGKVANQFQYELFRKRLRAVALVDYVRRPYVSKFDAEFRLTFDSELQGTKTRALFPTPGSAQTSRLLPGYTVMEVKFRHHIPSWFHRLLQAYELRRVSVSKICHAMEALEIAEDAG
jgi:VTC domain